MINDFKKITVHALYFCGCIFLLFIQHLLCFDFFDSNFWYLYIGAIIMAGLQLIILYYAKRASRYRWLSCLYVIVYMGILLSKIIQTLSDYHNESHPIGLSILCVILDAICLIFSIFTLNKGTTQT